MPRKKFVLALTSLGLILALFLTYFLQQSVSRKSMPPTGEPLKVLTVRVKQADIPELFETVGTLEAIDHIVLKSGSEDRVLQVLTASGQTVNKGDVLLKMHTSEIKAPFTGTLTKWEVQAGDYLARGTPLVELVNAETLSITYSVPEQYAVFLKVNQPVILSVRALSESTFQGTVSYVSPIVDPQSYTLTIRAAVPNPSHLLLPGMSTHVQHVLRENHKAFVIPESCLEQTLEDYGVYRVEQGEIKRVTVTLGARAAGRVQILAGLNVDDQIVWVFSPRLKAGMKVIVVDAKEPW